MIAQSHPLYVLDEDGNLYVVVGWAPREDEPKCLAPYVTGATGFLQPLGAMLFDHVSLRYFGDWDTAVRHSNGDFWRPE